jgi:hypothetical protein
MAIFTFSSAEGQDSLGRVYTILDFPNKIVRSLKKKTDDIDKKLTRKTEKLLQDLQNKEQKIRDRLLTMDSTAARKFLASRSGTFNAFEKHLNAGDTIFNGSGKGPYVPYMDSAQVMISFLGKYKGSIAGLENKIGDVTGPSASLQDLQSKLYMTQQLEAYIQQRKQQLKDQLTQFENSLPVKKYLDQYNQAVYYYSQQVQQYKEMLNNPDELLKKALQLLNQIPAFELFMKNNSQLASLFGSPLNYGSPLAIAGLQTRDQIQQVLQNQIGAGGINAFGQNLGAAQDQLSQYKDRLSQFGNGGDNDLPNFKPNNQKTKTFLNRLEYGINFQTVHGNYWFPTTTDIGLSVGYKMNDKGTAGIGASYKIGWGSGYDHISVSSQGASIRSFFDYQMKGSFYASGGLEYNYQQPFSSFQQIRSLNEWQQSGLIGVSKAVSLKGKPIKKTKLQLLWDFLSYYQTPRTQPLKFRIGYTF